MKHIIFYLLTESDFCAPTHPLRNFHSKAAFNYVGKERKKERMKERKKERIL